MMTEERVVEHFLKGAREMGEVSVKVGNLCDRLDGFIERTEKYIETTDGRLKRIEDTDIKRIGFASGIVAAFTVAINWLVDIFRP